MIIDVKTALDGCAERCKEFCPEVAHETYDGDKIKRTYRCANKNECDALVIALKCTMYDNVKEAINEVKQ